MIESSIEPASWHLEELQDLEVIDPFCTVRVSFCCMVALCAAAGG